MLDIAVSAGLNHKGGLLVVGQRERVLRSLDEEQSLPFSARAIRFVGLVHALKALTFVFFPLLICHQDNVSMAG